MSVQHAKLAIDGGVPTIDTVDPELFRWPIITREDEDAVLDVLRHRAMSGTDVTKRFEREFAGWLGTEYALGYPNGTESIRAAMWACGVGAGDEIICPSMTFWASAAQALSLGAAVNFCDIQADTLCIDPADVEHRIGNRTKAIVVVHYAGHPCDMDAIMAIAERHNVKVIEDVSHAQGALYKGKKCGTIGHVGAMSLMSGKSFAVGEAGMLVTNDRSIYERSIAYGHYERTGVASRFNEADNQIRDEGLGRFAGVPIGGYKHRMNQMCSAVGLVQLKYYPSRIAEIQEAMNYFWDLLEGVPGVHPHRPPSASGSTMGGWYFARGLYRQEELGNLSIEKFCKAVQAEGYGDCRPGANFPLHLHPVFHDADLFGLGKPTVVAFGQRDVRQGPGTLPVAERIDDIALGVPWFKKADKKAIQPYAEAFRKVAEYHSR